jgi:virginiamycin B lyase
MSRKLLSLMAAVFLCSVVLVGQDPPAARGGQAGRGGGRGGAAITLPDGNGKELVQTTCTKCHGLNQITNSWGYNREGWEFLYSSMVDVPPADRTIITNYLATHFPEKARPAPVVMPGKVSITIKEWVVPSLGSRPHDPISTPDGRLWWTGQWADALGYVNIKTNEIKEFPLNMGKPNPRPHGLAADRDGNIWYTGNGNGTVGKLNPKTAEVTEYVMPDPAARDPHTPIFDQKGILWFSLQGANMVGRLDPRTGEIKLINMLTKPSNPYGMVVDSKGTPFIVLFATNKIASIDPVTLAVKEYVLPNPATRPRRIAITSDDIIWYSDYSRGFLGRFDPKTGAVKEWASPSGAQSQPYGISTTKDAVWYVESAPRPNMLVRFDLKTEGFQSWVIPSGGGVVRNMETTRDGDLVLACSGVNRVAFVDVQ